MLQGTASHVGKSLLVAALCRIFKGEGLRVAPFKAQNMALNSFVTKDGGEIGTAQAFQAEAAGIEPTTDINPILLKPTSDVGSQVIIHGRVYKNMKATEYHRFKKEVVGFVLESYNRLAKEYDVIVIEGAGSPAEVNLRDGDIANMGLAELLNAPVILIGDIDRGGVFAHLVGTMELLAPSERERVKGFIINKFRGDIGLLRPGIDFLEDRTGLPVLGVVPYLNDIMLPDEDGVVLEEVKSQKSKVKSEDIPTAIIKLPRISNFTDFDPFRFEPDVAIRYITSPNRLEGADLVIIPGSKNTLEDLQWLWETGLAEAIIEYAEMGGRVIGICGGFQMLGRTVKDPYWIESGVGEVKGLGLLDVETVLEREKRTYQIEAVVKGFKGSRGQGVKGLKGGSRSTAHGSRVKGYEIHMGETVSNGRPFSVITKRGNNPVNIKEGATSSDGRIWGTYIHGIFENDGFRTGFLNEVRAAKGLPTRRVVPFREKRDEGIDRLAGIVWRSVDMQGIYAIMGLSLSSFPPSWEGARGGGFDERL
ncbi:MAG: cobyric acid synthase [Deltaproteobacteria bacterium]|nr:cobyric acid synthase [Deltaproteobacteria bacterium]